MYFVGAILVVLSCLTFTTSQISPGFFSKFDSIKAIDQQLGIQRLSAGGS